MEINDSTTATFRLRRVRLWMDGHDLQIPSNHINLADNHYQLASDTLTSRLMQLYQQCI